MAQTIVKATTKRDLGSGASRRLRSTGKLPGVIYGLNSDPVAVAVDYDELKNALKGGQGMNTVFSLEVDGDSETVIVRDVQRDAIRRVVTHADFLRIDPNEPVKVRVPVNVVGDDTAVTSEGGLIEQKLFYLEVEALPLSVPAEIEADVSIMTLDRALAVRDLNLPEGVTAMVSEEVSVVSPVIPRAIEEPEPVVAEGEEGVEGVEGEEGAEGAEGASGEDSKSDSE